MCHSSRGVSTPGEPEADEDVGAPIRHPESSIEYPASNIGLSALYASKRNSRNEVFLREEEEDQARGHDDERHRHQVVQSHPIVPLEELQAQGEGSSERLRRPSHSGMGSMSDCCLGLRTGIRIVVP